MKDPINVIRKLANYADKIDEIPIGAIIIKDNKIIAGAFNSMEKEQSSLAHAEIKVIKTAQKKLKNWRLDGCELYVTLEPCLMCSGAIHFSRIKKVTYLLSSNDYSLNDLPLDIESVNLDDQNYKKLLQLFFKKARLKKRYQKNKK
jgi:tRNA(adenine34) deaminase